MATRDKGGMTSPTCPTVATITPSIGATTRARSSPDRAPLQGGEEPPAAGDGNFEVAPGGVEFGGERPGL